MTLFRGFRAERPHRVVELEDEGAFAVAVQQAEGIRRNAPGRIERRQPIAVVIQVSKDGKVWVDAVETWKGPWRPTWEGGVPVPTTDDLREVAALHGARYARSQIRTTL
jgi:hypothetical protein